MNNKTPALIMIIIGFVLTIISFISSMIIYEIYTLFIMLIVASIITFTFGMLSLKNDQKSILIGVFLILFCGVVGGILYLVWEPNKEFHIVEPNETANEFFKDYLDDWENQGTLDPEDGIELVNSNDPYEQLKKLKDLLDRGIIDQTTYDEKAKKYIDML